MHNEEIMKKPLPIHHYFKPLKPSLFQILETMANILIEWIPMLLNYVYLYVLKFDGAYGPLHW